MSRKPPPGTAAASKAGHVSEAALNTAVTRYLKQLSRLTPEKEFSADEVQKIRTSTLSDLIQRKIFLKMAEKEGITVLDSDVRERYLIVCSGIFNNQESEFEKALAEDGWTHDEYLGNLREIIISERVREKVMEGVGVTPAEARAHYKGHPGDFRVEEADISHILVSCPARDMPERGLKTVRTELAEKGVPADSLDAAEAEEIAARKRRLEAVRDSVLAGGDFAAFAQRHSDDGSAKDGGALGRVPRGMMVKPFEEAAFALKKGGVSHIVETEFGFHIVKAHTDPAGRTRDYAEVETQLLTRLRAEKESEKIRKLEKKWKVKIYDNAQEPDARP
jgi:parvulin-like peptidyl-prolyl isomerase